jgi:hypothetical protein
LVKYSFPSTISKYTPVDNHMLHLKSRAVVHCVNPAFPKHLNTREAVKPYEAQSTRAPTEASVRAKKPGKRAFFGESVQDRT